MKKTTVKKIVLSKETVLSLQADSPELRAGGGNTGPSCEIFRACTIAGWDCSRDCPTVETPRGASPERRYRCPASGRRGGWSRFLRLGDAPRGVSYSRQRKV